MRKLLLLLILFAPKGVRAQDNLFISIEPSYAFGNRTFDKKAGDSYLSSRNAVGVGIRAGYQVEFENNVLFNANVYALILNNSVVLDYCCPVKNNFREYEADIQLVVL